MFKSIRSVFAGASEAPLKINGRQKIDDTKQQWVHKSTMPADLCCCGMWMVVSLFPNCNNIV